MWKYKVVQVDFLPGKSIAAQIEEKLNASVEGIDGEIMSTDYINPENLRAGLFVITYKPRGA